MSYALTLGSVHVLSDSPIKEQEEFSCRDARIGCAPSFVFSIEGQVSFKTALRHLVTCRKRSCRTLRKRVFSGMTSKLTWLFRQETMLGCVHVQPLLYGEKKIVLDRKDFPVAARHLSSCPKDSCAQLRRALLLTVRGKVRD